MALTAAFREQSAVGVDDPRSSRDEVFARYRQFREISKQHHHDILACISSDALLNQARRLGLAQGKTLILEDMEEMNYVYDLAIHTASPQRSRAIDRFAGDSGIRDAQGAWGVLSRNLITRQEAFRVAVIAAFAPFYNSGMYRQAAAAR